MDADTWVWRFNVNVFSKWAWAGVGVRAGWRVCRRYNPGFQGSKTSFINGRGPKLDADPNLLLKSTPRLSLAPKQQVTCKL